MSATSYDVLQAGQKLERAKLGMRWRGRHILPASHRQAAEDLEATVTSIQSNPRAARLVIEGSWGAAFYWIAFGCETKHGHHQDTHARLGRLLRSQGEPAAADLWEALEHVRQGGLYGAQTDPAAVQRARDALGKIHAWATS